MVASRCLAALMMAALGAWGCEPTRGAATAAAPGTPAAAVAQADTTAPRALLARWHQALVSADKSAYLACFVGSQEELVLALAGQEVVQANYAFNRAVVAAYGPDGWKVFQTSDGARIDLFPREPAWSGRITVVRAGRIAFAYLPRGRVPLVLSEESGVWRIHAGSLVPPGIDANRAAEYQFRWAAALRGLVDQVTQKPPETEKARRDIAEDFSTRVAPADRPAAAAAVNESFLLAH